ncbi:glycine receptor subunit alphaZ1-like [Ornithodoros turicata]|uniref:glycine receptor subunit alphaZ1-like n=1 Tax=Ornithodoros turicata TaxID=34597 RepID=UPI003138F215
MVNVSMKIMDVDDINEERMDFRLHTYIEESWRDPRLRTSIVRDWKYPVLPESVAALIWKPDVVFSNTKKSSVFMQSVQSIAIKIDKNGSIRRFTRYLFQVRCVMTFHNYPLDVQHCHFKVSLLASPNWLTDLQWEGGIQNGKSSGIRFVERIEPLQFKIKEPKAHRYSEVFLGENYTYLLANFTFVRRLTASIVNTYIPSGLIVVLSWLSFWIDITAVQGRISLGVTAILTLTTQVVQSRSNLPPVDYVKAVDIWLFACLMSVFASLLEYAVAYQYIKAKGLGRTDSIDEDQMSDGVMLGGEDAIMQRLQPQKPVATDVHDHDEEEDEAMNLWLALVSKLRTLEQTSSNIFDSVSRVLFPSLFILFMMIYWIYYTRI